MVWTTSSALSLPPLKGWEISRLTGQRNSRIVPSVLLKGQKDDNIELGDWQALIIPILYPPHR